MDSDRIMNSMMQSMGMGMGIPFGMFGDLGFGNPPNNNSRQHNPMSSMMPHGFMPHSLMAQSLMPHGIMNPMSMMMMDPFQNLQQVINDGTNNGGLSYCSSSITSYTTDEHGRPQVYQQSNEVKQGPGGVKETKYAVRDSRSGHQELAIGHHLAEKAHIKKKTKNAYTGEVEQCEDFVNLEEHEAETFEEGWRRQAKNFTSSNNQLQYGGYSNTGSQRNNRLALTSSAQEDHLNSPSHRHSPHSSRSFIEKIAMKSKKKKKSKESK